MAPVISSQSAIVARAKSMSAGGIAGAVVGSVIGGSLVLIVLGFLYFRYRRKCKETQGDGEDLTTKPPVVQRRSSIPASSLTSAVPPISYSGRPPSIKDDRLAGTIYQIPATSTGKGTHVEGDEAISSDPKAQKAHSARDFAHPPQQTSAGAAATQTETTQPSDQTATASSVPANLSYYDTTISMDSDTEAPSVVPPDHHMSELYEAQLKKSREHSKRGSGSTLKRVFNSIKKRTGSTQSSSRGFGVSEPQSAHQYFPTSPSDGPAGIKQEHGSTAAQPVDMNSIPPVNKFYAEPEEITESPLVQSSSAAPFAHGLSELERESQRRMQMQTGRQDTRQFSWRHDSLRQTTETDPELPSAVLVPDSSSSGAPHGLPPSARPPAGAQPHQERLHSPDIPEPMTIDTVAQPQIPSDPRMSHSPPLRTDSFGVSPMAVMHPSNAAEKAAYTHYQIENSASPPAMPASPKINVEQATQDQIYAFDAGNEDDIDIDDYLDVPSDDPGQSESSYDFSSTPAPSGTDPSMGRTPDTRITASPSPAPFQGSLGFGGVKTDAESSASPESSRLSPQPRSLTCDECGRSFDHLHKLNHHKRYHDRKHNCPYEGCDKKFGTKTHLDRHINDKHLKSKAYHCTDPSCAYFKGGKSFPRKDNWRRHMIKKHQASPQHLEAMDESMG